MKGRLGKFGIIFLAVTLALAITGAGFAKWSDTVTIEGTVNTGTVEVGIRDVLTYGGQPTGDAGPNFLDGGELYPAGYWLEGNVGSTWMGDDPLNEGSADLAMEPGHNAEAKNVASDNSENTGAYVCMKDVDGTSIDFVDEVTETIKNAYPYYRSRTLLYITNCGSVPVKIEDIDLTVDSGNAALLDYLKLGKSGAVFPTGGYVISEYDPEAGGWVSQMPNAGWDNLMADLAEYQLEPCHTLSVYLDYYFEEMPNNLQGKDVSFTITVTATQWNEVP